MLDPLNPNIDAMPVTSPRNDALLSLALPIPGYAGLRYDTQHLSPVSAERAAEGIEASFIFHSLASMTDGRDRYIAFQLYVPVAVRVYDPVAQRLQQTSYMQLYRLPEYTFCMPSPLRRSIPHVYRTCANLNSGFLHA